MTIERFLEEIESLELRKTVRKAGKVNTNGFCWHLLMRRKKSRNLVMNVLMHLKTLSYDFDRIRAGSYGKKWVSQSSIVTACVFFTFSVSWLYQHCDSLSNFLDFNVKCSCTYLYLSITTLIAEIKVLKAEMKLILSKKSLNIEKILIHSDFYRLFWSLKKAMQWRKSNVIVFNALSKVENCRLRRL